MGGVIPFERPKKPPTLNKSWDGLRAEKRDGETRDMPDTGDTLVEEAVPFPIRYPELWRAIVEEIYEKYAPAIKEEAKKRGCRLKDVPEETQQAALNEVLMERPMQETLQKYIQEEHWMKRAASTSPTSVAGEMALAIGHLVPDERLPEMVIDRLFPH